jgi:hypothetical protein
MAAATAAIPARSRNAGNPDACAPDSDSDICQPPAASACGPDNDRDTCPPDGGSARDGPSDEPAWLDAAYDGTKTLVTRIGTTHADHAGPGTRHDGRASSSATMPRLVLDMYRRARLPERAAILDVGTGSGYGTALLTRRFGVAHVTSIDIDPWDGGPAQRIVRAFMSAGSTAPIGTSVVRSRTVQR